MTSMDRALLKAIESVEDKVDSISTGGSSSSSSGTLTAHTHVIADITSLQAKLTAIETEITNLKNNAGSSSSSSTSTGTLTAHTHSIADITSLQTQLDAIAIDITNLKNSVSKLSSSSGSSSSSGTVAAHSHVIADITSLQTQLDNLNTEITNLKNSGGSGIVTNNGKNMWLLTKAAQTEETTLNTSHQITGSDSTVYKSAYQIIDSTTIYIKLYRNATSATKFIGIAKFKIGGSDNVNILDITNDWGDYTTWLKIGTDSSNSPIYLKTMNININELNIPEEYQSETLTLIAEGTSTTSLCTDIKYTTNYDDSILTYSKLRDLLYPVGSIYTSTQNTKPSEFIGGVWESITAIATDTYSWKRTY